MTTFDVIGGIELTIGSAIVIAAMSIVMGEDVRMRMKLAAGLGAWFVLMVVLAATGALHQQQGIGSVGVGVAVIVPIAVMWMGLWRAAGLRVGMDRAPMAVLVGVHVVRVAGICFIILQGYGRLPAPFAPTAGWGDILAGLAAIPIAWSVHKQTAGWRWMLLAWNVFGMLDLASAIGLGVLSSPGPLREIMAEPGTGMMSTLPWLLIPGFLVPLLATIHLMIFYRLSGAFDGRAFSGAAVRAKVA